MIIEEKDFRLIPVSDHSPFFDLELMYTVKPKGKEIRQEFKNVAYGITLSFAIKSIARYRVNSKHEDEAISIKTYFSEFRKELDSLKNLCNI